MNEVPCPSTQVAQYDILGPVQILIRGPSSPQVSTLPLSHVLSSAVGKYIISGNISLYAIEFDRN